MLVARPHALSELSAALARAPVVAILGPRQAGKTTLAREVGRNTKVVTYFDLEDPRDLARLQEPMLTLKDLKGLVIIDEVQRMPNLFDILRVLADRRPRKAKFLLLGSASLSLLKRASESLAGRIAFIELDGFTLDEVGVKHLDRLWWRGGFPLSFGAKNNELSRQWCEDFVRTFLERDIPALGINVPAATMRRFWTMVAHYHGQLWNASEFARALGTTEANARKYLDIVTGTFVVRQLQPWHENVGKRQVKSPKIYLRDSGLLHTLLDIESAKVLAMTPRVGASWEGFVIEQLIARFGERNAYFWATHGGAELDLLLMRKGKRIGVEVKRTDSPTTTKSMHSALADLKLDKLFVIHAGSERFALHEKIEAIPAHQLNSI